MAPERGSRERGGGTELEAASAFGLAPGIDEAKGGKDNDAPLWEEKRNRRWHGETSEVPENRCFVAATGLPAARQARQRPSSSCGRDTSGGWRTTAT
jgi:hypothetical protein